MKFAPGRGFTLLEVLLALAIYTLIGIATVRHLTQLQNTKNTAFEDLDLYSDIRSALSVLRADLNQGFHIQYDDLGEENKQAVLQNQSAPHTIFDGRKAEIIFTSLSHRVYYAGRRETEQTEISYFLQRKDGLKHPSLMKRESELIDADLYQGGNVYTILDNVLSLEFRYWDDKQQKWIDDWNSDGGGTRDRFPLAIKVNLAMMGRNNKKLEIETQLKIAFPNNEPTLVQF